MCKYFTILLSVVLLNSCTDFNNAKRILSSDGVTNIQYTGYQVFGCSEDDFYHTGFKGIKNGKEVEGVVCGGFLFKGSTIRYF